MDFVGSVSVSLSPFLSRSVPLLLVAFLRSARPQTERAQRTEAALNGIIQKTLRARPFPSMRLGNLNNANDG